MALNSWPLGEHVEDFLITLPDGEVWTGSLYRATSRRSGRRIVVRDALGKVLYDGDESFDFANAQNGLDLWLKDRVAERSKVVAA